MGRDPKQVIGDISEFKAVIKFLKEGYMVFKNMSAIGPIDLVLVNQETGEVRFIDVKTISYRKVGTKINRTTTTEQNKLKVELIYIDKED
jgi:Holliday junction resolvase-like predicted endonuclease|tara:strand:- start:1963 stop:2232 length:270 start_codon:yes stop_codon:yes gene_type:complete